MTAPSQLEIVRREIADIKAEILETKEALAAAQEPADTTFWRKLLEQLNRQLSSLREQETVFLQGQLLGEQCLLCYLFPPFG